MNLPDRFIERICDVSQRAGAMIMNFYRREVTVVLKGDSSPLTSADTAAHEFLVQALDLLLPDIAVVSEESDPLSTRAMTQSERFWLVDPLDGTKEFLKGTNEFTVNVALIEAGRPLLGVVHAPALGLTYFGRQGGGACRQTHGEKAVAISPRVVDPARLCVVASKDHSGPLVEAMLSQFHGATRLSMGSSLKFCLVAEGKADVYLRDLPTMEWDTAAAQCIVEAAGGRVCTFDGKPLSYAKPGLTNPALITFGDPTFDWTAQINKDAESDRSAEPTTSAGFAWKRTCPAKRDF